MDCLDRTNVVQSMLGRWVLNDQLRSAGVISKDDKVENHSEFMFMFRNGEFRDSLLGFFTLENLRSLRFSHSSFSFSKNTSRFDFSQQSGQIMPIRFPKLILELVL